MVGDDHVGSLRLQVLPAAHLEAEPQQVLHVADQEADNPEGEIIGRVYMLHLQSLHVTVSTVWTLDRKTPLNSAQSRIIPVSLEF